jgi:SnoaL-like domain
MSLSTADVLAITRQVGRLCQALDFSRPTDFVDIFTADGVYQAVSSTATGEALRFRHKGPEELLAFAESAVEKRKGLGRHWTGNLVIDGDGASATAVSYVLFIEIDPETKERRIPISGVHRDAFVKDSARGWLFISRTVVADV